MYVNVLLQYGRIIADSILQWKCESKLTFQHWKAENRRYNE